MMGRDGLKKATQVAILSANYIAHRLSGAFPVLYTGQMAASRTSALSTYDHSSSQVVSVKRMWPNV